MAKTTAKPGGKGGAVKRPAKAKGAAGAADRRLGLRGAAPWAARHAAKHAEEAKARNAAPPPPGSARATLREPAQAEELKARVAELNNALSRMRVMRKNFEARFFELGEELIALREARLYEAKGYVSLESFAERELELGKVVTARLVRVPAVFLKDAAAEFGSEALFAALAALETASGQPGGAGNAPSAPVLPLKPPAPGRGR
jgi:hypothetical protein